MASDSPQLHDLLRATHGRRAVSSAFALQGPLVHTGIDLLLHSRQVSASLAAAASSGSVSALDGADACNTPLDCTFLAGHRRAIVDWYLMSIADAIFTVGMHMRSSFVPSALSRAMIPWAHVEFFEGVPKLACADKGACARPAGVRSSNVRVCLTEGDKGRGQVTQLARSGLFEACRGLTGAPSGSSPRHYR